MEIPKSIESSLNILNYDNRDEEKENKKMQKVFDIQRISYFKDKGSNIHCLSKTNIPKNKKNLKLNDLIPNLNNIKIKFTKRENVDKKIIKLFKNFIKDKIRKKDKKLTEEFLFKNLSFWNRFIQGMFTPPFYYMDESRNESIEFKSMNSLYIIWIFQNEFANELYFQFLKEKGNILVDSFIDFFDIKEEENIKTIKYYIRNFNKIFSLVLGKIHFFILSLLKYIF